MRERHNLNREGKRALVWVEEGNCTNIVMMISYHDSSRKKTSSNSHKTQYRDLKEHDKRWERRGEAKKERGLESREAKRYNMNMHECTNWIGGKKSGKTKEKTGHKDATLEKTCRKSGLFFVITAVVPSSHHSIRSPNRYYNWHTTNLPVLEVPTLGRPFYLYVFWKLWHRGEENAMR